MARRQVWLIQFGVQPYAPMQALQNELVLWRQRDLIGDAFLLLEHTPVITLGRRADKAHILATPQRLESEGIEVHQSERGGDVTYHGPGQLVGYPILHLPSYHIGASDYMHRLEEVILRTLADYGLVAHRRKRVIGLWVGDGKIAAFGVRIKRGVTLHGFALNVRPNMLHWSFITPCGITDGGVTSMALELQATPPMREVRERVADHFESLFDVELVPTTLRELQEQVSRRIVPGDQESIEHQTDLGQRSRTP